MRCAPPFSGNRTAPNAYLPTGADSELPTVKRTLCKDKQVVEFLKEPQVDWEIGMSLNMGQWLSIPFVLLGAFGLYWINRKKSLVAGQ